MDNENRDIKTKDDYDLGTFSFLKVGWWVLHLIAIAIVFYLGYAYGAKIF